MKGDCPLTGETAEVARTADRVAVEHPRLGAYAIHANALASLEGDAEARERMVSWIAESRLLDIDIPDLTVENVHIFERLGDLGAVAAEWTALRQAMSDTDDERLWRKLRLEWNYNSNHIEGNTLTYHETELLLIHGRSAGGHPMRHYEEMKAHDVAISHVRRLSNEERILGEGDARDLNRILLKEPFWHVAETPDGEPTRKRIVPGVYKTQPNHVRTETGALHRFAEPEETPALMESWTRDFQRDLKRSAYPLPLFLAESHWSFLRIHPFDDGNGRTARLVANYALLRLGLPPIVIRSAERDRYIAALQSADLGRIMPLARFMLDNVLWVLELGIRAAKGESIREAGDVEKEVALFVRRHRGDAPNKSDVEVLDSVVDQWIRPTLARAEIVLDPLRQLFHTSRWRTRAKAGQPEVSLSRNRFEKKQWERTRQTYIVKPGFRMTDDQPVELAAELSFANYIGRGRSGFGVTLSMAWTLDEVGVSLVAEIDGQAIASSAQRVRYTELEERNAEADHTVDTISQALINEIARRSSERS